LLFYLVLFSIQFIIEYKRKYILYFLDFIAPKQTYLRLSFQLYQVLIRKV